MNMNNKNAHMGTGVYVVLISSFIFAFVPNFDYLAVDSGAALFFSHFSIGVFLLIPILHWKKESLSRLTN